MEEQIRFRPREGRTLLAKAASFARREGTVFLDSALARPGAFSLLATDPQRWIDGRLPDVKPLEEALEQGLRKGWGSGGLAGAFAYDGRYRFGVFPRWEVEEISVESGAGAPAPPIAPFSSQSELSRLRLEPQIAEARYLEMVRRALEYIAAGDIYQACLAYPMAGTFSGDAWKLYLEMRAVSPAPFAAFLHLGKTLLLSSSPELFLRMRGREAVTRPIKGTRARPADAGSEGKVEAGLLASAKERAELVMITDLERNDLGRVCEFGSVAVDELYRVERFAKVFHLVSTVRGRLRDGASHPAALAICFPGGSITGAPKKRAMEIIAELEPFDRGFYTGAIGCFGFSGLSVFNIAIRTMEIQGQRASYGVGAGIVADSNPEAEWKETLAKAAGLAAAPLDHCAPRENDA